MTNIYYQSGVRISGRYVGGVVKDLRRIIITSGVEILTDEMRSFKYQPLISIIVYSGILFLHEQKE